MLVGGGEGGRSGTLNHILNTEKLTAHEQREVSVCGWVRLRVSCVRPVRSVFSLSELLF